MVRLDEQLNTLGKAAYRLLFQQIVSEEVALRRLVNRWEEHGEPLESCRAAVAAAKHCRRRQVQVGELSLAEYVASVLFKPFGYGWDSLWLGLALTVGGLASAYGFGWLVFAWADQVPELWLKVGVALATTAGGVAAMVFAGWPLRQWRRWWHRRPAAGTLL